MEKHVKANLIWVISLLVFVIVAIASIRIPSPTRFTDIVSFAATISSLILAVFAIFQGLLAASDAEGTKREAAAFNAKTAAILESIDRQIPEINREIRHVGERVGAMWQFQDRASASGDQAKQDVEEEDNNARRSEAAKTVVTNSSTAGLLALEAACLSFQKKKPFRVDFTDQQLAWYVFGYVSSLGATLWITYRAASEGPATVVHIDFVSPSLLAQYELIKVTLDNLCTDPAKAGTVIDGRKQLLALFSDEPG